MINTSSASIKAGNNTSAAAIKTSESSNCKYSYQIVSLAEWLDGRDKMKPGVQNGNDVKNNIPLPLVDLRSQQEFNKRQLSLVKANCSTFADKVPIVNLPLDTLLSGERSCELPPRHVEFAILIPQNHSFTDCCPIHQLFFDTQSKSTSQSRKPWLVRQVLMEDERFWENAKRTGLLVDVVCLNEGDTPPFRRGARLWKPDPLVASDVHSLLKEWLQTSNYISATHYEVNEPSNSHYVKESMGVVLDLGSGAGRDICFLAEELKEFNAQQQYSASFPLCFIGIDNHKGSAKRCLPLWEHRGVKDVTHSMNLDLNKLNEVQKFIETTVHPQPLQSGGLKTKLCIFAIRYLNRKLFAYIAHLANNLVCSEHASIDSTNTKADKIPNTQPRLELLPTGTIIAISHFCKPAPNAKWEFDHPKESSVLCRWELKNLFESVVVHRQDECSANDGDKQKCWKVLKDEICEDGDHGRTLIQFVAVKII